MKTCPYCGAENSNNAQCCQVCLTSFPTQAESTGRRKGLFFRSTSAAQSTYGTDETTVYCEACGTENEAQSTFCSCCGSSLGTTFAGAGKRRRKKWLGIAAGVLAAAVTAGGVYYLTQGSSRQIAGVLNYLESDFTQQLQTQSTLQSSLEQSATLLDEGAFALDLQLHAEAADLAGTVYYDRKEKCLRGQADLAASDAQIDTQISFSANQKEIQFKLPQSPDIYGCNLDEFSKTSLAKLLPVDVSSKNLKALFSEPKLGQFPGKDVRKAWSKLVKSMKLEESSPSDNYPGCTVYQVTWDKKAVKNLLTSARKDAEESLDLLNGLNRFAPEPLGSVGTDITGFFADYMEQDCRAYVDSNGRLQAIDLTVKRLLGLIGEEDIWTIEFQNPEHPWMGWELTSLKNTAFGVWQWKDGAAVLELDIEALNILSLNVQGTYDDDTGHFQLGIASGELGLELAGKLACKGNQTSLTLQSDVIGLGQVELTLSLSGASSGQTPTMLSDNGKYVDITKSSNWERMKIYLMG